MVWSGRTLVLYRRPGCHICDQAEVTIREAARTLGRRVRLLRVDISEDPGLLKQYLIEIPVLAEIDGRERLRAPFDREAVVALLLEADPLTAEEEVPEMSESKPVSLSERGRSIPGSPTMALDAKAKAMRAKGENVLNLAVGEPDLPPPSEAIEAAQRGLATVTRYTPPEGRPELRKAIADAEAQDLSVPISPDMVLVGTGAKQVLFSLAHVLFDPGDRVLVPSPYWVSYPDQLRLAGVEPVFVPTREEEGWRLTEEAVRAHVGPGVRGILLNSPNNPSGAVISERDLAGILTLAQEYHLWVVSDEIYSALTYTGQPAPSALTVAESLGIDRRRVVLVDGASKKFAMTGFRVGWAVADPDVVKAAGRHISQVTSCVSGPAQLAAEAALKLGPGPAHAMRDVYHRRRDRFVAGLNRIGLKTALPEGAFYAWASAAELVGHSIGGTPCFTTESVAGRILEVEKVATVPGEAFGVPGYLRLSFANDEATLDEALVRLERVLAEIQSVPETAGGPV